jgi:hypothetical protein
MGYGIRVSADGVGCVREVWGCGTWRMGGLGMGRGWRLFWGGRGGSELVVLALFWGVWHFVWEVLNGLTGRVWLR